MPWITTAPISSGRFAKQSWIARMIPSFSALRLAGRLRPTVSTEPDVSILSSAARSAVTAAAAFPIYCVLRRIVIFYNHWRGSQCSRRPGPDAQLRIRLMPCRLISAVRPMPSAIRMPGVMGPGVRRDDVPLQHLMDVDHDAVGVAGGGADENVLHQPAIFFVAGLEFRHGAEIDQFRVDRLAALQLLQEIDRAEAHPLVLDIDGRAIVGLESVFGLELDQFVGADDLEVGAERADLAADALSPHLAASNRNDTADAATDIAGRRHAADVSRDGEDVFGLENRAHWKDLFI